MFLSTFPTSIKLMVNICLLNKKKIPFLSPLRNFFSISCKKSFQLLHTNLTQQKTKEEEGNQLFQN